jgi:hypothetical protein
MGKKKKPTKKERNAGWKGPSLPNPLPSPGLSGDYRGSCVICMRGTETAIGIRGAAEAGIAFLCVLGLNAETANATFEAATGCDRGMVPTGINTWTFKLCEECVKKAPPESGARVGDPRLGEMPVYDFTGA